MNAPVASESMLRALLAQLGRARDTPLQFGLDGRPLIPATLPAATAPDWQAVVAEFDALIAARLAADPDDEAAPTMPPPPCSRRGNEAEFADGSMHPLETWLDRVRTLAQTVQPQAIAILAARVDGFSNRDIARRLGLGQRMVGAIVADLREPPR